MPRRTVNPNEEDIFLVPTQKAENAYIYAPLLFAFYFFTLYLNIYF